MRKQTEKGFFTSRWDTVAVLFWNSEIKGDETRFWVCVPVSLSVSVMAGALWSIRVKEDVIRKSTERDEYTWQMHAVIACLVEISNPPVLPAPPPLPLGRWDPGESDRMIPLQPSQSHSVLRPPESNLQFPLPHFPLHAGLPLPALKGQWLGWQEEWSYPRKPCGRNEGIKWRLGISNHNTSQRLKFKCTYTSLLEWEIRFCEVFFKYHNM